MIVLLALLLVASADTLPRSYLDEVESRYQAKPLITHQFKPEQKRPNPAISSVFLLLTSVVPIAGVSLSLTRATGLKPNWSLISSPWVLLFHGVLFGALVLLGSFFVALNLVQTVALAVPLLISGLLVGRLALD